MNLLLIFILLFVVSIAYCDPVTNGSSNCVCGSKVTQIGETDEKLDDNPWIVGVFAKKYDIGSLLCTGSLISNQHVLVSGVCANEAVNYEERHNYQTQIQLGDSGNLITRNITYICRHENFERIHLNYHFDIGLLHFDKLLQFGHNVRPICLPQNQSIDYSGKLATITGISESSYGHFTKSQRLNVPIWTNEQCANITDYEKQFTEHMLCVGDYKDGACRPHRTSVDPPFDAGHIVIKGEHGSIELVGIYSFRSTTDNLLGNPTVYTRVADFLPWIRNKLGNKILCEPENSTQKVEVSKKIEITANETGYCFQTTNTACSENNCACGLRGNEKQIVDEVYTLPNKYPWVVGVYEFTNSVSCSGSLISNKHVIVSAYCALDLKSSFRVHLPVRVHLGANPVNAIKRGVSRIILHENFPVSNKYEFNIAILQLDQIVVFSYNIQPICLPRSSPTDYAGKVAQATGWYHNVRYRSLIWSRFISQQWNCPIWTNEECAKAYKYADKLTNNMICAGEYEYGTRKFCIDASAEETFKFDQIVIEGEHGRMELVGIYSFGPQCETLGVPTVYTRVANFVPWIESKITNQCTRKIDK